MDNKIISFALNKLNSWAVERGDHPESGITVDDVLSIEVHQTGNATYTVFRIDQEEGGSGDLLVVSVGERVLSIVRTFDNTSMAVYQTDWS